MSRGPMVLIVEDHAVLSQALAGALAATDLGRVEVLDPDALTPAVVLEAVEQHRPDVVLLDLNLGDGRRGTPLVKPIMDRGGLVVILTASTDDADHGEALEAGAVGVLTKSQPFHELVDAVVRAAAGERLVTPRRRDELVGAWRRRREADRRLSEPFERLTESEAHVLASLVHGLSTDEIAAGRGVAVGTVRTQVKSMLRKLQVNSQLSAVALARDAGWPHRR